MSVSDIPSTIRDFFATSQIPLALTNPRLPDDPLILGNASLFRMTGYGEDEFIGKNCRILQGPETTETSRHAIARDLSANRDCKVLIRNHRKSGEAFDNFLYIFAINDPKGSPIFRIGSQFEVPEVSRRTEFASHASALREGLEAMNAETDIAQQRLVETGDLIGLTVKSLVMARLEMLKSG